MTHFVNLCPMQVKPVADRFVFMDTYGDVYLLTPTFEPGQPFIIVCLEKRGAQDCARRIMVEY